MRTTVEFDEDTASVVEALRRDRGVGVSQAVNELIRLAVLPRPHTAQFRQGTARLGMRLDVSNIAETLDLLDGPTSR